MKASMFQGKESSLSRINSRSKHFMFREWWEVSFKVRLALSTAYTRCWWILHDNWISCSNTFGKWGEGGKKNLLFKKIQDCCENLNAFWVSKIWSLRYYKNLFDSQALVQCISWGTFWRAAAEYRETIQSDLPFTDPLGSGKVRYCLVTLLWSIMHK